MATAATQETTLIAGLQITSRKDDAEFVSYHNTHLNTPEQFYKSISSLADTCEDYHTGESDSANSFDREETFERSQKKNQVNDNQNFCKNYAEGFCMKGGNCEFEHESDSHRIQFSRGKIAVWIIKEIPEIMIISKKRMGSFLN